MNCLGWLIVRMSGEEEPYPAAGDELPGDLPDAQLDFVERETSRAQGEEERRERGVQARLIALLGLSSLVTAVLGVLAAFATAADFELSTLQLVIALLPLVYVAVQAIASIHFTIAGLMPRPYPIAPPWGESRRADEPPVWDRFVLLSLHRSNLRRSRWSTNRRMEDMTLALESLRRFAWGSLAVFLAFLFIALDREFGVASHIIDMLQRLNG